MLVSSSPPCVVLAILSVRFLLSLSLGASLNCTFPLACVPGETSTCRPCLAVVVVVMAVTVVAVDGVVIGVDPGSNAALVEQIGGGEAGGCGEPGDLAGHTVHLWLLFGSCCLSGG